MTLTGFKARNHPQQTAKGQTLMPFVKDTQDEVDDRTTTREVFDPLHERYGFTIDAAASARNARLPRFWTKEDDGLAQSWAGERVWCNPPYSDIEPWVRKAQVETQCPLVVMLLPANRTEQSWWQDAVERARDREGSPLRTRFLRGRLRFIKAGKTEVGPNERPPFGCVLLIWDRESP